MEKHTYYIFSLILALNIACTGTTNRENKTNETKEESRAQTKIVDLTHEFSEETVYWVTARQFDLDTVFQGYTEKGYYYSAYDFTTAEHGGTHIDAPIHFAVNTQSVDQIPLERLIGDAIKIDVSDKALQGPDYLISVQDLKDWERTEKMSIPEAAIVLLQTGHSKFYKDKKKYLGTDKRGEEAVKELHFPGLSPEAAKWLVEHRNINAIGIDTPSIDYGQSEYFQSHIILLSQNIPVFENLMNLDQLPTKNFEIIALPMKIKNGSGGPLRIIARFAP